MTEEKKENGLFTLLKHPLFNTVVSILVGGIVTALIAPAIGVCPVEPTFMEYVNRTDATLCTGGDYATDDPVAYAQAAWTADLPHAASCARNLLNWRQDAAEQQQAHIDDCTCDDAPSTSASQALDARYRTDWALDNLAIGLINLGWRLKDEGQLDLALEAFQLLHHDYSCAWIPDGSQGFRSARSWAEDEIIYLTGQMPD